MSSVNYLEKLLDGVAVEWKPLGELADIYGGLTGKSKADFDQGNARYITYKNIFSNIEVNADILDKVQVSPSEKQNKVQYGDILFTGSSEIADEAGMSSAVTTQFDEAVYLNSFSIGVRFKNNISLSPEFAKYLFRNSLMRAEISKTASGVTRFNVSKDRLKKILIPILSPENPEKSLEIQAEIVRILDAMIAHTAELTAELTARKKQYNYYRDKLLSFEDGEVEWKTLGDVCEIGDGNHSSKYPRSDEMISHGIPFIRGTNMINGTISSVDMKFISEEKHQQLKKGQLKAFDVLLANRGEIGKVAYIPKIYENSNLNSQLAWLRAKKQFILPRFLFYVLNTSQIQKNISGEGGALQQLTIKNIKLINIPVPSINLQEKIITILDKFDTLANSISKGLPREIELRQKQYAHYRDLLLSFPKPEMV